MRKVMFYLFLFIAGFVVISLWNFYTVVRPPQINVDFIPDDFDLPNENVKIRTHDGLILSGWLIPSPAKENKKAVIILHGYPAEKGDMLFFADALYPDFTILLLDLRFFGESDGNYTTLGIEERRDVKTAVNFLVRRGYEEIGLFGFSLGGAIGLLAAADDPRIGAAASYASFANLRALGYETYSRLFIFKKPMVELMLLWSRLFFGESAAAAAPERAAAKLRIPTLIVHSKQDEQIAFDHALRLQEALKENDKAEFHFLDEGRHGMLPGEFYEKLNDFFLRSLQ